MKPNFLEYIQDRVILGDGALGAYLYQCGVSRDKNIDLLNLQSPETVHNAHEEYIRAGSQLIETNTFGASRYQLEPMGFGDSQREINRAGAEIAVKAAGGKVFVAGSVGPSGIRFPLIDEETTIDEIRDSFREQFLGLAEGGVDAFIIETFSSLDEMLLALEVAKETVTDMPIIAQMVFPTGGTTTHGEDALHCGEAMLRAGADVIGTNCGRGVDTAATAIRKMAQAGGGKAILSAFPNAGMPEMIGHRTIYPAQPDYMAKKAAEMIRGGVHLIGGCCGTTPAHIQQFKSVLKIKPVRPTAHSAVAQAATEPDSERTAGPGKFLAGLTGDRLPIIVELDPPTHLDIEHVLTGAEKLAEAGTDAISLAENPLAILRTGNLGLASLIQKQAKISTILHQTGRDLNALALQARMMEAHLLDIPAVLGVTGDSATGTDQPGVSGVFDLRSHGIISMLNGLNNGANMAGKSLKKNTDFSIGAAFSFRPQNPDFQIRRLEKKVELGARFVMTQPLFSAEAISQMVEKTSHINAMIFPGIFPLISLRNAEFLHNEVPGIHVPSKVREQLARYDQVADQRKVALEFTAQLIDQVATMIDGIYLISPLNKWDIVLNYVKQIRNAQYQGSGRIKDFTRA
ncbi:bifunctional homocysteine S-methyltransferase/methylenetetrahydrofolate reductase [Desulfosediminicola ganghwensis]|uniref:bifunctional homocysteine S-methyltransferase/methylenetetrahydrofolate reductase n=1 Tax=Desulfosediminicola ganghwensis TaxID=2569540 RepID=UPI0010AC8FFF|nr:bifunctional homocysteine S-methyltransferase/methylenetetrahydrofolate reductase [Desulfosediminicola ganghwensis]